MVKCFLELKLGGLSSGESSSNNNLDSFGIDEGSEVLSPPS